MCDTDGRRNSVNEIVRNRNLVRVRGKQRMLDRCAEQFNSQFGWLRASLITLTTTNANYREVSPDP